MTVDPRGREILGIPREVPANHHSKRDPAGQDGAVPTTPTSPPKNQKAAATACTSVSWPAGLLSPDSDGLPGWCCCQRHPNTPTKHVSPGAAGETWPRGSHPVLHTASPGSHRPRPGNRPLGSPLAMFSLLPKEVRAGSPTSILNECQARSRVLPCWMHSRRGSLTNIRTPVAGSGWGPSCRWPSSCPCGANKGELKRTLCSPCTLYWGHATPTGRLGLLK